MKVPVWASRNRRKVTIEFAGQKSSVKAGTDGKWRLELKPMTARRKAGRFPSRLKNRETDPT